MHCENPEAFFLLLLVPILYLLRVLGIFKPITLPLTINEWGGRQFTLKVPLRKIATVLSHILAVASFVLLTVAATNPVVRRQEKVYLSRGSDILYVIDVSPSMAAQDMDGISRIEAARNAVIKLESKENGNAAGLVEMAKEAALVVPPTMDRKVFFDRLENLLVGEQGDGTSIGNGLLCALFHLQGSAAPQKSIVLITDGENNAGSVHPLTSAHLIKENGVSLYVLGIGTKGSVPIEYTDPKTGKVYSGMLESDYNTASLMQISSEAGGKFFEASSVDALMQSLEAVGKAETLAQSYQMRNLDQHFYAHFLVAALIFFCAAFFVQRICLKEAL